MSWVNKSLLAKRFDRRITSYDEATPVQAGMGDELLRRTVERMGDAPVARILELGCGTGRLTGKLVEAFPNAAIIAVDISEKMAARAAARCPGAEVVVADAEDYVQVAPAAAFDLVISNATAQWFADPASTVGACLRLLSPRGHLALSTFGEQTFRELNQAFGLAYRELGLPEEQHASPLPSADFWRSTFPDFEIHHAPQSRTFPDVPAFLRSLQQAGVTHAATRQPELSRKLLHGMMRHYDPPTATYDIIYLHANRGGDHDVHRPGIMPAPG